eukprot:COSAG01_NODE_10_length_42970_cov_93.010007_23_plen_99_part_00
MDRFQDGNARLAISDELIGKSQSMWTDSKMETAGSPCGAVQPRRVEHIQIVQPIARGASRPDRTACTGGGTPPPRRRAVALVERHVHLMRRFHPQSMS